MYRQYRESWNYSQVNPYPNYNDMIAYTDKKLLPLGFKKEVIGKSQDGEFNLYGYSLNLDKPVFWLDSNIHGSEWWTCYYCLDFLVAVWGDTYFDKRISKLIRENFGMYYVPSVNPWGYQNVKYPQSRGVNLNRNFDAGNWENYTSGNEQWKGNNFKGFSPASESETQAIQTKIKEIKPYIAINCHTTTGNGSGVDVNTRFSYYKLLTTDMLDSLKLTYPGIGTINWNIQFTPSAESFYGQLTSKEGTPTIASVLEHQSDTDKFNVGYATLFIIALTTINWKNNHKLKMNHLNDVIS